MQEGRASAAGEASTVCCPRRHPTLELPRGFFRWRRRQRQRWSRRSCGSSCYPGGVEAPETSPRQANQHLDSARERGRRDDGYGWGSGWETATLAGGYTWVGLMVGDWGANCWVYIGGALCGRLRRQLLGIYWWSSGWGRPAQQSSSLPHFCCYCLLLCCCQ